jgi:hypothetical protein
VRDNVTISYRGASYEIGRGPSFYGIWGVGQTWSQPLEWWPDTPEGWYAAWWRFMTIERPETIAPVAPVAPVAPADGQVAVAGRQAAVPVKRAVLPALLLAVGVGVGIAGLFPDYLNGESLTRQTYLLVPHAIYLAVWTASGLLLLRRRGGQQIGTLLGMGTSIVTFGLYFADAGTAIAQGAHVMGAGLVLALVGWLACSVGSTTAFVLRHDGVAFGPPRGPDRLALLAFGLAALGTAAAFAPSWDSYVLQTSAGTTQSFQGGNIFSNPGPVIAGNLATMVALVAVAVVAALWRPILHGAVLLLGAIVPMLSQAASAVIQIGEPTSPSMFGISSSQAARAGLTITSGLTLAFWIYCVFLLALMVVTISALIAPRSPEPVTSPATAGGAVIGHDSPVTATAPPGPSPFGPAAPAAGPEAGATNLAPPPAPL